MIWVSLEEKKIKKWKKWKQDCRYKQEIEEMKIVSANKSLKKKNEKIFLKDFNTIKSRLLLIFDTLKMLVTIDFKEIAEYNSNKNKLNERKE